MVYILPFSRTGIADVAAVGGKNASLGEMFQHLSPLGVRVPDGFSVTADAYRHFLRSNGLDAPLRAALDSLQPSMENLPEVGERCRALVAGAQMPDDLAAAIRTAYAGMMPGEDPSVAVRSSATAEDLPTASFAGQHESYLNIRGAGDVVAAVQRCYVSLFNDRAIKYRVDHQFPHMDVALSAGVQHMVRSDSGSAGVCFTLDPESGFRNAVYITGVWGLGENIVQGAVTPDEWVVFKPTLAEGRPAIVKRRCGPKEKTMVYGKEGSGTLNIETPEDRRSTYTLNDELVHLLARWCVAIESHYGQPMDIEWARDGENGELYIVQARPETVHSQRNTAISRTWELKGTGNILCTGKAVGKQIVTGRAVIISSLADASSVQQGDIIVADITNPDWNALLKKAVSIVTNKGGRTSHASIVARELGIPAIVGTGDATERIRTGQLITVCCEEKGTVYDGAIPWEEHTVHFDQLPTTRTTPMLILANPDRAFELSFHPAKGVGLLRMEFIISNTIVVHPMALVRFETLPEGEEKERIRTLIHGYSGPADYFIQRLSESVAQVAAAFHPHDVIVRMSDFKTNEYASLLGGRSFEPEEENPMLGFRGASRYYNERYRDGFLLECAAMKRVRDDMGFTNVKLMIPFCRTVEEGKKVVELMATAGLQRGVNGLEIYVMTEIPSNVILAEQFAEHFDGFSIGSNDLTQLTLGIDRDSSIISDLFDERNEAAKWMMSTAIRKAHAAGRRIGLCGQAASDHAEMAQFLVDEGIHSISFTPDSLVRGIQLIHEAEVKKEKRG